jgi:Skp family chaperone for outer membrane proteins
MILSAALGVAGMLFTASVADAQPGGAPPGAPPGAPTVPATRPTIAVFNMAAVMRDFGQAKYQVWLLNKKKDEMSKQLVIWRGDYIKIQTELRQRPDHPEKDQKAQQMLALARQIEDEDRRISKQLNDDASAIIGDLYDKMKAVVDKTAELNGYHIVFAYPDAVTPDELKSAYIKELKLKPPAAQPFYVAPHADITAVVVKTLNVWYPPVDPQTKQPIDVSKLDIPTHATPANGVPGGGPAPGPGPLPSPGPAPGPVPGPRP